MTVRMHFRPGAGSRDQRGCKNQGDGVRGGSVIHVGDSPRASVCSWQQQSRNDGVECDSRNGSPGMGHARPGLLRVLSENVKRVRRQSYPLMRKQENLP